MSLDERLDVRKHVAAIKATLDAAAGFPVAFEWGEVPGEPGTGVTSAQPIWTLVSVRRRENLEMRVSGNAGSTYWEVTVGAVGDSPKEVQWALYEVGADALNENVLTIAGTETTPLEFSSPRPLTKQGSQYFAADTYTYAL